MLINKSFVIKLLINLYLIKLDQIKSWNYENECKLEYLINLDAKPDLQHKENTIVEHKHNTPILVIGNYQWIQLKCTCCCNQSNELKQYIFNKIYNQSNINYTNFNNNNNNNNNSNSIGSYETNLLTGMFLFRIISTNNHVVEIGPSNKKSHLTTHFTTDCLDKHFNCMIYYMEIECPQNQSNYNSDHITLNTTTTNDDNNNSSSGNIVKNNDNLNKSNNKNKKIRKSNPKNGFYLHASNLGHSYIITSLIWMNISSKKEIELEVSSLMTDTTATTGGGSSSSSSAGDANSMTRFNKIKQKSTKFLRTNKYLNDIDYLHKQKFLTNINQLVINEAFINLFNLSIDESNNNDSSSSTKIWIYHYLYITVLLRPQKFYIASDWSSTFIAFMLALSTGCCDDPILIRTQLKQSKIIISTLVCQYLILPLLSIGLGFCFSLNVDQAFGLLTCSVVPAGGLAYLLTYLAHGDRQLSAALSLISSLLGIIFAPLWLWIIGWYWFNRPINIGKTIGYLILIAGSQTMGTIIRGYKPSLAHIILTWITRPLLLLSGILLVTLGVYINHYALNEISRDIIFALLTLMTSGFIIGWLTSLIIINYQYHHHHQQQQHFQQSRTLSTNASVFNGLLCMPLLRTSLHAPEGDLASVAALWATFLTPIPLVYHAAVTIFQRWLTDYLQTRRKKYEENCMSSMIGGKQYGFGAASVAAVAAAAVAVTPAIAAGTRQSNNQSKNINLIKTNDKLNDISTNRNNVNNETNSDTSPSHQQSTTTTTTITKKTSPDTLTPPLSPIDHPSVTFSLDTSVLDYENTNLSNNNNNNNNIDISNLDTQDLYNTNLDIINNHEDKNNPDNILFDHYKNTSLNPSHSHIPHHTWTKRQQWLKEPLNYYEQEPILISPKLGVSEHSKLSGLHMPSLPHQHHHHSHHTHHHNKDETKHQFTSGTPHYTNL